MSFHYLRDSSTPVSVDSKRLDETKCTKWNCISFCEWCGADRETEAGGKWINVLLFQ